MKTSIVSDCMKSSNSSGNFTHILNDMENTINSTNQTNSTNPINSANPTNSTNPTNPDNSSKLSIDFGNSIFLELDKLNISEFTTHKISTLIIGKRETGKTQLIKDFMIKMKNNNLVDTFVIFTCDSFKSKYNDLCVSTDKIITTLNNVNIIENLLDYQEENPTNKLMIIFDDYISDKKMLFSKAFKELIFNARHYNIGIILSIQYPIGFSPEIRANMDFVMVYNENILSNQKRIYEHYFGIFPTFSSFNQVIKGLNSYECLVCDNLTNGNEFNDKVKYYKSNYIPPNETNKIKLFDVNIIKNDTKETNKTNEINEISGTNENKINNLIKRLEENNKKIKIIMKENEKITKKIAELAELDKLA